MRVRIPSAPFPPLSLTVGVLIASYQRQAHSAVLLDNGRVLVTWCGLYDINVNKARALKAGGIHPVRFDFVVNDEDGKVTCPYCKLEMIPG